MKYLNIFLSLGLILVFVFTHQTAHAQTKVGITAGANFSKGYIENENGNVDETQGIPGIRAGLTFDIPVIGNIYIQPAAIYSQKGFKQNSNGFAGIDNEFKAQVSYFEVPVNLLYKPKVGSGNLVLGAGPYIGYGLGGQWETQTDVVIGDIIIENSGDVIFKKDVKDGEFGNYLYGKPLDYGVNLLAGYDFWGVFSLQVQAQLGLANIQPEVDGQKPGDIFHNRSLNVSVGYKF
ncbi:PorT family protein [Membranicola marinus]|uniref:PorT family protein n=1 Tax=Membranihabitans marinus TaxID=1227546 RepID=A0A953L6N2_9BACT|nr:outer membrane beta-barrel protein [Membranihabitans marinus]MBY5957837.1 PorT family protein [Membranihabitans marinus]